VAYADLDRRRAYQRKYYKQPKQLRKRAEQQRAHRQRRARRFRLPVFERDDYTCVYCEQRFDLSYLTVDHKTPKSQAGDNDLSNLLTACRSCNSRKGVRSYEFFMAVMHPDRVPEWV